MALADFLGKKYKLAKSENFDEMMKALGVSFMTRTVGASVSPIVELTEKEGTYHLKTSSTWKTSEISFKPGEQFDEETPDGRKVKSTVTIDGSKMTHVQTGTKDGEKTTTIIREYGPSEMKAIMTVDDITCTRYYKLQE